MKTWRHRYSPGKSARRRLFGAAMAWMLAAGSAHAVELEKTDLKFGFIKLTDSIPVIVALEKGFFEEEGLGVTLEAQSNWKVLLDRVISGELDGAHMLPGQAIGATVGVGTKADMVAPFAMGLNTLAVTVSNDVWEKMKPNVPQEGGKAKHPIGADAMKPVVEQFKADGDSFKMGMVFPTSTHNYLLRYWLAAGGIHPGMYSSSDVTGQTDADVLISVTPPPQMPATLEAGTISGYSVGEPWNEQAVFKGIGVPVVTADQIWSRTPEKVFGMRKDWVEENPNTTVAIVKALIKAAQWLDADSGKNREEAVRIVSQPQYIGADFEVLVGPLTGNYEFEKGDKRPVPAMNVYYKDFASYPYYSDAVWYLTQMRRWGQIGESKQDAWYDETAKAVYRPDIYLAAAKALISEGKAAASDFPTDSENGYGAAKGQFIDGKNFDATKPNAYVDSFTIGMKSR